MPAGLINLSISDMPAIPRYAETTVNTITLYTPATYCIKALGLLSEYWSDDLGGMAVHVLVKEGECPMTTLTGEITDQEALLGLLNLIYELRLPLISVKLIEPAAGELNSTSYNNAR